MSSLTLMIVLIPGCVFDSETAPPPTDEELTKVFTDNKDAFVEIYAKMIKNGYRTISLDPEWSDPEITFNAKKPYHDFLRNINAHRIAKSGDTLWICVWSVGLGGDGDYKGYIYQPDGTGQIVESLDNFSPRGEAVLLLRVIGDGWYLYYDHVP